MALIPMVIEREGNRERSMDLYSKLMEERIIVVQGPVESNMANIIKGQLLFLEKEDPDRDIIMYIDSPGGEVITGMGIVDTMNYISCDVQTICFGMAASMGSFILMQGAEGKRFCLPHSEIMVHQISSGTQGKFSDMERSFKHTERLNKMLRGEYVKRCGGTDELWEERMDRDTWLTPQEAIEFGLIDNIITTRNEAK
jgi:ATP-dependent Clp protease protease subunit